MSRTNLGGIKLLETSLTEAILNDADLTVVAGEGLQDSGLEINKFCRTQTPFGIVISNCRDKEMQRLLIRELPNTLQVADEAILMLKDFCKVGSCITELFFMANCVLLKL